MEASYKTHQPQIKVGKDAEEEEDYYYYLENSEFPVRVARGPTAGIEAVLAVLLLDERRLPLRRERVPESLNLLGVYPQRFLLDGRGLSPCHHDDPPGGLVDVVSTLGVEVRGTLHVALGDVVFEGFLRVERDVARRQR